MSWRRAAAAAPHPHPQIDLFGESTRGNLHFADESERPPHRRRIDDVLGLRNADDILAMPWAELRQRTQSLLGELGVPPTTYPASQPQRALFTNRTLNLRNEGRFVFLNTLFSVSEAVLYMQASWCESVTHIAQLAYSAHTCIAQLAPAAAWCTFSPPGLPHA